MRDRAIVILHDVALSCRCVLQCDRDRLFGLVPGAAIRCPRHGMRMLLSRTPRPEPWELRIQDVGRRRRR